MRRFTILKRSFATGLALCMALSGNGMTSRAAAFDNDTDMVKVVSRDANNYVEEATPLDGEFYYDNGDEVDSSIDLVAVKKEIENARINMIGAGYSRYTAVNASNFPDANLRTAIINSAKAQNAINSKNEVDLQYFRKLTISNTTINSLQGLDKLLVENINIENAVINDGNFSIAMNLGTFTANNSTIRNLKFSGCQFIYSVKLDSIVGLTSINFNDCESLNSFISKDSTSLTSISVNGCKFLNTFSVINSPVTSLSMDYVTELKKFELTNAKLESIQLNSYSKLTTVNVSGWGLSSLDVSKLYNLSSLTCSGNSLTKLDLRNNKMLRVVKCNTNKLNEILFDSNNAIEGLYCQSNALTKLDLGNNRELKQLYINDNKISSINVKNCSNLRGLSCSRNNLSALDVSSCPQLTELYCSENKITSLDVSNNTNLKYLKCKDNRLPCLNLYKNIYLLRNDCELSPQQTLAYLFGSDDKLNISLVKGMEASRVSNVSGASLSGYYLNLNSTGKTNKKVTYTYKCDDYFTMNVSVVGFGVEISKVTLDKTSANMTVNDKISLNATLLPADAADKSLSWTSSNTNVATVSNGVITAVGSGKATITAKSWNGVTATCTVTVTVPDVSVYYKSHVQDFGWEQGYKSNGTMSGTSGMSKRLEAMQIYVSGNKNLGIQYVTHCQNYGWLTWSTNNEVNGTSGEAKRLEAIKIQLTGRDRNLYDVYYRVHAQDYGWLNWAKNGEPSGSAGYSKRLEGIQILVVKKGTNINKNLGGIASKNGNAYISKDGSKTVTVTGYDNVHVQYQSHVQDIGWQSWRRDGDLSGTSGQSKRLEAIRIRLSNNLYSGGITYQTHIQNIGWQGWRSNGDISGTSGQSKRLEAIRIKLTGEMAEKYDIYYCGHAQNFGWLGWAKNGEPAGTEGYAYRLESIKIVLVPKGGKAPGATNGAFRKK